MFQPTGEHLVVRHFSELDMTCYRCCMVRQGSSGLTGSHLLKGMKMDTKWSMADRRCVESRPCHSPAPFQASISPSAHLTGVRGAGSMSSKVLSIWKHSRECTYYVPHVKSSAWKGPLAWACWAELQSSQEPLSAKFAMGAKFCKFRLGFLQTLHLLRC